MLTSLQSMIRNVTLFKDLTEKETSAILKTATKKTIPAKTTFIQQGEESDAIYFVESGSVSIFRLNENGEEINISILGTGDIVGEMALIDQQPRSAFAKTLTESTFLVISSSNFSLLLNQYPTIAIRLLALFSQRLRQTDAHVEDIITQNLETRTLNSLKILRGYFANGEITLTHEELSAIVGATRARVTKTLDLLQEKGLLTLSHKKILLT